MNTSVNKHDTNEKLIYDEGLRIEALRPVSCPHETSTRVAINNKLTFLSDVFKKTENHQYPLP